MSKIILTIKNKQFLVGVGNIIKVDKLDYNIGEEIIFDSVMMLLDHDSFKVGYPYIKSVIVKAEVMRQITESKIRIIKFKRRKHYKLNKGHRQKLTEIKITYIDFK